MECFDRRNSGGQDQLLKPRLNASISLMEFGASVMEADLGFVLQMGIQERSFIRCQIMKGCGKTPMMEVMTVRMRMTLILMMKRRTWKRTTWITRATGKPREMQKTQSIKLTNFSQESTRRISLKRSNSCGNQNKGKFC